MKKEQIQQIYDSYTENEKLKTGNIFHLFDSGINCMDDDGQVNGFVDCNFFSIIAFNTHTKEKKILKGTYDGIQLSTYSNNKVEKIRIFADGSTLFQLKDLTTISYSSNFCID